jgi:hypothetical protein
MWLLCHDISPSVEMQLIKQVNLDLVKVTSNTIITLASHHQLLFLHSKVQFLKVIGHKGTTEIFITFQ